MKFEDAHRVLKGIPFISDDNAKRIYDFIITHKITSILELGFAHGVASCYMAAALDELGGGQLVSVDLEGIDWQKPSIEELLDKLNLRKYVTINRQVSGYNWFLHDDIVASTGKDEVCKPKYDLCIIDGPKNWVIDSSAFFLADKLLLPNGWIIFDDYDWTYEYSNPGREVTDGINKRSLSMPERTIPHIKEVFHLLVMQHPSYSNFLIDLGEQWAWAQKKETTVKEVKYVTHHQYTYKDWVSRLGHKLKKTGR